MHNEELSNKLMAEVFDDDFISSAPPEVRDFVNDLLLELATTPSARPDSSLVEFLDVASLPSQPMVVSAGPTRSKKMITGIGAFVATTVGKVVSRGCHRGCKCRRCPRGRDCRYPWAP